MDHFLYQSENTSALTHLPLPVTNSKHALERKELGSLLTSYRKCPTSFDLDLPKGSHKPTHTVTRTRPRTLPLPLMQEVMTVTVLVMIQGNNLRGMYISMIIILIFADNYPALTPILKPQLLYTDVGFACSYNSYSRTLVKDHLGQETTLLLRPLLTSPVQFFLYNLTIQPSWYA